MGLFRRTPKGKHALGAAVTSIPSGPLRVAAPLMAAMQPEPAPVAEAAPVEPTVMSSIADLIASGEAWESDLDDFHALHTPGADLRPDPVRTVPEQPVALPPPDVVQQAAPAPAAPPPAQAVAPPPPTYVPPPVVEPVSYEPQPAFEAIADAAPAALEPVVAYAPPVVEPIAYAPPVAEPTAYVSPDPDPPPHVQTPAPVAQPAPAGPSARSSLEAALAELLPQQAASVEALHVPSSPRVQLGFRDGTSASLDPESEQALALEMLAQSLTRRD